MLASKKIKRPKCAYLFLSIFSLGKGSPKKFAKNPPCKGSSSTWVFRAPQALGSDSQSLPVPALVVDTFMVPLEVTSEFGAALSRPTLRRPGCPFASLLGGKPVRTPFQFMIFVRNPKTELMLLPPRWCPASLEGLPTTRAALLRRELDARGGHTPSPPLGENGVAVLPQKMNNKNTPKILTDLR